MRFGEHFSNDQSKGPSVESIAAITNDLLLSFQDRFAKQNIVLETDLSQLDSKINSSLFRTVVCSLIENAIDAMPNGGELTITLLGDQHHWELEIADSGAGQSGRWGEDRPQLKIYSEDENLRRIIAVPVSAHLHKAQQAAMKHGCQIQSWDCPQGGTAHVLVVPKEIPRRSRAA